MDESAFKLFSFDNSKVILKSVVGLIDETKLDLKGNECVTISVVESPPSTFVFLNTKRSLTNLLFDGLLIFNSSIFKTKTLK